MVSCAKFHKILGEKCWKFICRSVFKNILAFNLISFLFMSSSLSTKICSNWFWKYFWIARLNFSIISLVIFITTTWFDEAMALLFLGRWLISEISPNIDSAFSSAMMIFPGSCSDIWFFLTSTLVFFEFLLSV